MERYSIHVDDVPAYTMAMGILSSYFIIILHLTMMPLSLGSQVQTQPLSEYPNNVSEGQASTH